MKKPRQPAWTRTLFFAPASFALLGIACTDSSSEGATPRSLVGPFESNQRPEDVAALLKSSGLTWTVIETSNLPEGRPRPRFSIQKWQVDEFRADDLVGEAHFQFFNDRLLSVTVFPTDPSVAAEFLEQSPSSEELPSRRGVRIRMNRDYRGKPIFPTRIRRCKRR